jgi:hypothetical protein
VEGSDGGERERGEELGQSRGSRGVWEREIVDVSGSVDECVEQRSNESYSDQRKSRKLFSESSGKKRADKEKAQEE